jgi:hypothetical protein
LRRRLIENWLTSVSERELDIPFRLLLEAEGHQVIGYRTVHGMLELGKDIVSYHSADEIYYFFQLKQGDIRLSDWNEMERQLRQMIETPYVHPNYSFGDPFKPVWVCTGQLDESVRATLGLENEKNRQQGKPTIEVWDRNVLINKYYEAFFDILFVDELFVVDFIRTWSRARSYQLDEDELREFFHNCLFAPDPTRVRETQKHLATYVLVVAQTSQRYASLRDPYSAIDCINIGATIFWEYVAIREITSQVYANAWDAILVLSRFLLENLAIECKGDKDSLVDLLSQEGGPAEIFEYPLRVHSLASKMALGLVLKSLRGQDFSTEAGLLGLILTNNPVFCHIISERQMGTFWISMLGLLAAGYQDLAPRYVSQTLEWVLQFHGEDKEGLPDPYSPYETAVGHHLGVASPTGQFIDMKGESYMLPVLLRFACLFNQHDVIARTWPTVSLIGIREYVPTSIKELFQFIATTGRTVRYGFASTQSWTGLQEHFTERLVIEGSDVVEEHPESLLFLALAYPWRTQWRETTRFILEESSISTVHTDDVEGQ